MSDQHVEALRTTDNPIREIAALAGVRSLATAIKQHLDELQEWWGENQGGESADHDRTDSGSHVPAGGGAIAGAAGGPAKT